MDAKVKAKVVPEVDAEFSPAILHLKAIEKVVKESGGIPVSIAVEQADGSVYWFSSNLPPAEHPFGMRNDFYLERLVNLRNKLLL